MSTQRIAMLLIAVTLSIGGLNAQDWKDSDRSRGLKRINKNNRSDFDFNSNGTRIVIRNGRLNNIPLTRRGRRVFRKRGLWDRSWALDRHYPRRGTDNFVNVYLGLNNWLEDGDLPGSDALYNLSPISSWYAGVNFDNITKVFGPLYLDWGVGISLQDFSFENTRVRVDSDQNGVVFSEVTDITGRKSKINVTYLNLHFVPTISFGRYSGFRVGLGVYGGYRIGSHTKMKFDDVNGDKQKDKIKDSFNINPFKYGLRAQVGWDFFDLFFNYDLTDFFDEDVNAPRLTPVTFGVIL